MTKHLIVPDTQVKFGEDFTYLNRIGKYLVEKKPDVVVHLGAFTISGESLNFLTVSASSPLITAITLSQKDTSHFTHFVIVDNFHLAHFTVVYILFHASFIALLS